MLDLRGQDEARARVEEIFTSTQPTNPKAQRELLRIGGISPKRRQSIDAFPVVKEGA